ncbi:Os01g0744550 [Oryza sativa Japonica Group]|uniref:Os01g0744550 protein n=1 Tax=Oryza sativa subsp. japonica TaxID=39947 RepID=A0A0P0V871_ORYSJ|nr:hypothetical protein EE612_005676 [Oryza sativa]BAS74308.1 Os01g0744550 [Oryza sativa Japonica Group]
MLGSHLSSGTEGAELSAAPSEFPESAAPSTTMAASSALLSVDWTSTSVSTTSAPISFLRSTTTFSSFSAPPSSSSPLTSLEETSGLLALASTLDESTGGEGLIFSILIRSRGGCLLFLSF